MDKLHGFRKAMAGVMSAAMLAVNTPAICLSQATAAYEPNYADALALSLYLFDANACGEGITGGALTWRQDCHLNDKNANVGNGLDSETAFVVDPDGDGKIDVSGGFHDAGDHIKFNLTIGFAMSHLGLSEYLNEGVYEKADAKDHLIAEMRRGADYLMKTTFLNDMGEVAAVAHVVEDGNSDHAYWGPPERQDVTRPVYWITADNNNSGSCGEMAAGLAAAAYIIGDKDPEYAKECLRYAKALYKFGMENYGQNADGLYNFYYNAEYGVDYHDELAWAQAWLWMLGEADKPTAVPKDNFGGFVMDGAAYYDGYINSWDKVWQAYSAFMYKATGDKVFLDELAYELQNQGGLNEGYYNAEGWGATRYNCAKQMNAYLLAQGDPDSAYAKGGKFQMDYILGNNNINGGMCFLVGLTDNHPQNIHHRAANPYKTGLEYIPYGMLVGGPTSNGFNDDIEAYQSTEGALDYNACFAVAAAGLANLYGNTPSGELDAILGSAPEMNHDFSFKKEEPVVLEGNSLTLNENIGVNFIMSISPEIAENPVSKIVFETADGISESPVSQNAMTDVNGKPCYKFTCDMPAKEMTVPIRAWIESDGYKSEPVEYSIMDYANSILENEAEYDPAVVKLVRAMLNYGGYSQLYFEHNTENLANANIDSTLPEVEDVKDSSKIGKIDGLKYGGTSLLLNSKTVIRHYFKPNKEADIDSYKFTTTMLINGSEETISFEPQQKGDWYYFDIENIDPSNYSAQTVFCIESSEGDKAEVVYSVNDYISKAIEQNVSTELTNTAKAMYWYGEAARAYVN